MTARRRIERQTHDFFEVPRVGWGTVVACTWQQMRKDNLSALAAGSAFYALLSIFPTLTALVSLYGLVADPATVERQVAAMAGILPPEAVKLVATWLQELLRGSTQRFGIGLILSIFFASWSAWSATGMLMTAVNICYGDDDKRSYFRFSIQALALSAGLAVVGVAGLALLAIPPILSNHLPLPEPWHTIVSLVRWPILAALALIALGIIYRYAPARGPRRWHWGSWGAAAATALWLIGSIAFTFYVSRVGSYDKTYGSLGAVIVLLLWLYMSAYVILIGAELNAEIERQSVKHHMTKEP